MWVQSLQPGGGGLRGGPMRGSPSAISVGCGSRATLTAPPEISLMRSVLLLHAVLATVVGM